MQEKVKEFCYSELKKCEEWGYDSHATMVRCFGAVMFVLSIESDDGLGQWWDNEMHPRFRELEVCQ